MKQSCLAILLAFGASSWAQAQLDDPCSPFYGCSNDLRFFEPVDLDLDCRGCCGPCGFYFNYDKIWWATSGERAEIGDPYTEQHMFRLYSAIPLDPKTGDPINPPILPNSITSAIPRATFHNGDRYEFGYWGENGRGWLMSVLNGPDQVQSFTLGSDGGVQGGFQDGNRLPIGDVYVAFRTDPGLLAGFIDLDDGPPGPDGNILGTDDNDDGTLDGDGFTDDVNDNGQHGADGFDTVAPFNEPDTNFVGAIPDYGDLVVIPISFGTVNLRNSLSINGFELMHGHRLDNSHFKVAHQNNHFELSYGARFLQLDDQFVMDALGVTNANWSIGDTFVNQTIVNNIVGPQVGYKWAHSRGRWSLDSVGKFMFGYNIRDWEQTGTVAEDATPTRYNHPLYIVPHSFSRGRSDSGFSPAAELRLNLNYRLTDNIKLRLGYTGTFVNNIRRASTHIDYVLYEDGNVMGFRDVNEGEDIFSNGVNLGVEITQ